MKNPLSAILTVILLLLISSCSEMYDPMRDDGIPWAPTGVTFGIFSESVPITVLWDTDTKLDIWSGINLLEQGITTAYGTKAWKLTSTTSLSMGMGIRVEPISQYRDMSQFDGGKLHFSYKGSNTFKVGVKSGTTQEAWIPASLMMAYGLQTNDTWCDVNIPVSALIYSNPFIDLTSICQYFMWVVDSAVVGDIYYLDEIYWSKDYTGSADRYVPTNYGLYSDTVEISVLWDNNCKLDIWTDYGAGMTLTNVQIGAWEGLNCWLLTGTGAWMGMGLRVNPVTAYKDMSEYALGALHFAVKGTNNFSVGIQSGSGTRSFISNQLTSFGYVPDGNWHEVIVPLTNFTGIDFTKICQYFMFMSDASTGYFNGVEFTLDNIYWSLTN